MSRIAASAHAVARTAQDIAALAADRPLEQDEKSAALALIAHALYLTEQADTVTASAVTAARDHGCTWQDIGSLLGTTRQAAFQRFGRPIDPHTGTPMLRSRTTLADRNALDVLSSDPGSAASLPAPFRPLVQLVPTAWAITAPPRRFGSRRNELSVVAGMVAVSADRHYLALLILEVRETQSCPSWGHVRNPAE
jgi:hypothetical protein